jgi:hypothetical protein
MCIFVIPLVYRVRDVPKLLEFLLPEEHELQIVCLPIEPGVDFA